MESWYVHSVVLGSIYYDYIDFWQLSKTLIVLKCNLKVNILITSLKEWPSTNLNVGNAADSQEANPIDFDGMEAKAKATRIAITEMEANDPDNQADYNRGLDKWVDRDWDGFEESMYYNKETENWWILRERRRQDPKDMNTKWDTPSEPDSGEYGQSEPDSREYDPWI